MHFVTVFSDDTTRTPWFFIAALVGPIAEATCGIAMATAPIPTRRRTWRHMMFMTQLLQGGLPCRETCMAKRNLTFFPTQLEPGVAE
jgi:hypothetical protein